MNVHRASPQLVSAPRPRPSPAVRPRGAIGPSTSLLFSEPQKGSPRIDGVQSIRVIASVQKGYGLPVSPQPFFLLACALFGNARNACPIRFDLSGPHTS